MRSSIRWLFAFILGQIVATVALSFARTVTYTNKEVACVVIICVLVDLAILLGMRLSVKEAYDEFEK